jgi:hypothetical protein
MHAVQAALTHVAAALTAGLLERHKAGHLLFTLQQAASNLRFLASTQPQAAVAPQAGSPPAAPEAAAPQRAVEEYPEFEAEYGLPPGLDLTLPPAVVFPPPQPATGWAAAQTTPPHRVNLWTKEAIELEELEKQRTFLSEESYCQKVRKVNGRIHNQATRELRREREAEWEAEAARRNAEEEEKRRRYRSMDAGQQRAYWEGVLAGQQAMEMQRREEEARAKKPAAKVGREEAIAGMGKLPTTEEAK